MAKPQYLLDENFLIELDNLQIRHQVARITVLDFKTESKIEDITGRITTGNISINGDSAVRRTANLTFVIDDVNNFNLFKVSSLLSINKKIKLEVGIENPTDKYQDDKIIWFPQGIYIIAQVSISSSTSGVTASIQLKDKMCLLNGEFGGVFPAQTRLDKIYDIDSNGVQVIRTPTIYQIIQEVICHFGGENLGKIIINDVGSLVYQTMVWQGAEPLYVINDKDTYIFSLNKSDVQGRHYTEYKKGDEVCYAPTDFIYPTGSSGELTASAGGTVTSVLDNIKNVLGNFEYFYDLEGNFIFQEIKNYLNTSQATYINKGLHIGDETAYYKSRANGKSIYSFSESPLIISYNVNPNYINIKNDFVVWGHKKGEKNRLIRYHLAIDEKPELINFPEVYVYKNDGLIMAQVPFDLDIENKTNFIYENGIGNPGIIYRYIENNTLLEYQRQIISNWREYNSDGTWKAKRSIQLCYTDLENWDKNKELVKDNKYIQNLYREIMSLNLNDFTISNELAQLLHFQNINNSNYISYYYWDNIQGKYIDVTNSGKLYTNYMPEDWRTVLYLQGSLATPYGTDSNYYYAELKNEWPKIYDLRPKIKGGYSSEDGFWNCSGTGQSFWQEYVDNPQELDYFLDFINPDSQIGEFNIDNIGRRQKIENIDQINCLFSPHKLTNIVVIKEVTSSDTKKSWRELRSMATQEPSKKWRQIQKDNIWEHFIGSAQNEIQMNLEHKISCIESGRAYTEINPFIYNNLAIGTSYVSAFERIRSNLEDYTDFCETISISAVPIYHLEPNTRIFIANRNLHINGDYLIRSLSIPLGNGTMSIQANKVNEKI